MMKVYELTIVVGSHSIGLMGDERLRTAFNQWRDGGYVVPGGRIYIEGWYDDAQHTAKMVCLNPESIESMVLSYN